MSEEHEHSSKNNYPIHNADWSSFDDEIQKMDNETDGTWRIDNDLG